MLTSLAVAWRARFKLVAVKEVEVEEEKDDDG